MELADGLCCVLRPLELDKGESALHDNVDDTEFALKAEKIVEIVSASGPWVPSHKNLGEGAVVAFVTTAVSASASAG